MCSARTYRAVGGIFILFVILALLFEVLPQFKAFEVLEGLVGLALFTPLMILPSSAVTILVTILYLLIGFYYFWIGKKNKQPNKVVGASVIFFIINLIIVGIAVLTVTLSCAKQDASTDCGQSMFAFIAPIIATQVLAFVILVIGLLMGTKKTKKRTKAKPKRKKRRK